MAWRIFYLFTIASCIYFFLPSDFLRMRNDRSILSESDLIDLALSHSSENLDEVESRPGLISFGHDLFFSEQLSSSKTVSCASCHRPELSFSDGKKLAVGNQIGRRHTPHLINVAWLDWFFWDGRALNLKMQAASPIESVEEHNFNRVQFVQEVITTFRSQYEQTFEALDQNAVENILALGESRISLLNETTELPLELATFALATMTDKSLQTLIIHDSANAGFNNPSQYFKDYLEEVSNSREGVLTTSDITQELITSVNLIFDRSMKALAAFQKTITANDSDFDKFLKRLANSKSLEKALSSEFTHSQWQGYRVFAESGCISCHSGPNFTDSQFHNIGLEQNHGLRLDLGRAEGLNRIDGKTVDNICHEDTQAESCQEWPFLKRTALETLGAFKTPGLRNVSETAPYFHDGRASSLDEVLNHYGNLLENEPSFGHRSESLHVVTWTDEERKNLQQFFGSLSSPVTYFKKETQKRPPMTKQP